MPARPTPLSKVRSEPPDISFSAVETTIDAWPPGWRLNEARSRAFACSNSRMRAFEGLDEGSTLNTGGS
jgi:hypothetical protein